MNECRHVQHKPASWSDDTHMLINGKQVPKIGVCGCGSVVWLPIPSKRVEHD